MTLPMHYHQRMYLYISTLREALENPRSDLCVAHMIKLCWVHHDLCCMYMYSTPYAQVFPHRMAFLALMMLGSSANSVPMSRAWAATNLLVTVMLFSWRGWCAYISRLNTSVLFAHLLPPSRELRIYGYAHVYISRCSLIISWLFLRLHVLHLSPYLLHLIFTMSQ